MNRGTTMAWTARAQALILVVTGAVVAGYDITKSLGDFMPVSVVTGLNNLHVPCYLKTPKGQTIEFRPDDQSTDRIMYIENLFSSCGANITNLSRNDEGDWKIYYISGSEEVSATYHLTIERGSRESEEDSQEPESNESVPETETAEPVSEAHPIESIPEVGTTESTAEADPIESTTESVSEEDDNTEWLSVINISTRTGQTVDISLSRKELDALQKEKFTIITPQNQVVELENANIPGLTIHESSKFVASRITIGPMDNTLLGRWTLCGELNNSDWTKRCQLVSISWNSVTNPSADWDVIKLDQRDVVTNYLATIDTAVTGLGSLTTVMTCYLITPDGEDLILTTDSAYPGITFVSSSDTPDCRVRFTSIHEQFIGDWILYGTFRSLLDGVHEIRQPLHLFLYDEENPYSQAYNVTTKDLVTRVVNLGTTVNIEVSGSGNIDNCEVRSPSGQTFDLQNSGEPVTFLNTASRIACAVSIGPIREDTFGDWILIGKFSDREMFTEKRQTTSIIQEDPENPIEEDRTILTRDMIYFNTTMGAEHTVVTDPDALWIYKTESCHIRTPSGLQYIIMDGFDHPGIEIIETENNRCGVKVTVESEGFIGEWTLISREERSTEPVEVRQPFSIHVEELVYASANDVIVTEGNNLHVRLANPTNLHDTCKLYGPDGTERTDLEVDARLIDTCGFIVRNIQIEDNGVWEIRYESKVSYRAQINVEVRDVWEHSQDTLVLTRGRSVNKTLGPESAVYCKLTDPTQRVVFEGFDQCNLALDRVTNEHAGTWLMSIGLQGNILIKDYHITAQVRGSDEKSIVTTYVAKEQPEVTLKCSVPVEYEVKSCLFQDPSGRALIASEGVAEDRYTFHGTGTTVSAGVTTHECGLHIANPETSDLGIWRCAVQTDQEVYYGFLTVLCPWAITNPTIAAAIVSEPTLTARQENIVQLEGDSLTMSCSIQSPIRYCYFRRPNGTTYSVAPGVTYDGVEYVGSGLDAGECGIRFKEVLSQETGHWPEGRWSCHVGLPDATQPEQRVNIQVQINSPIVVNQHMSSTDLVVEAEVYQQQPLEYCRYVRIDGLGFTKATLPDSRYRVNELLTSGHCGIVIENPTVLDMHPWTITAKILNTDEEISGVTNHTIELPPNSTPEPEPEQELEPLPEARQSNYFIWWWFATCFTGVLLCTVGILIIPPRNRKNTMARATVWRESIRRSFKGFKTLPLTHDINRSTPMSA